MIGDMGIFRTTIAVSSLRHEDVRATVDDVMVDTGSEYSWLPAPLLAALGIVPVRIDRFETAEGRILERPVGYAVIYAVERGAPTLVVFANESDMTLVGAHAIEGLNVRVDLMRRELLPAGPVPAAVAA